jgi:hypothetical protein
LVSDDNAAVFDVIRAGHHQLDNLVAVNGDGDPIDYARQEPFRSLGAARDAGQIKVQCLGAGVDALNFIGDNLTVAVFDAAVFDEIFDGLVESNEGGIITGSGHYSQQFTFDSATIERLLSSEPMTSSGAGLSLAWQHRDLIR